MPSIAQSENDFCSWKEMQLEEHQNHKTTIKISLIIYAII